MSAKCFIFIFYSDISLYFLLACNYLLILKIFSEIFFRGPNGDFFYLENTFTNFK
jgi:hypothetical protein